MRLIRQQDRILTVLPRSSLSEDKRLYSASGVAWLLPVTLVRSGDENLQKPAIGVYENVAFAAFDLFVAVITDVILSGAPLFPSS